jgi:hypothetical protein
VSWPVGIALDVRSLMSRRVSITPSARGHGGAIVRFPRTTRTNDMSKNKQLKELFIEDLGQVTGGKQPFTTLAIGEEDLATTLAIGEEDHATTLALGEEEPLPSV